jgi:hypothetical protein
VIVRPGSRVCHDPRLLNVGLRRNRCGLLRTEVEPLSRVGSTTASSTGPPPNRQGVASNHPRPLVERLMTRRGIPCVVEQDGARLTILASGRRLKPVAS